MVKRAEPRFGSTKRARHCASSETGRRQQERGGARLQFRWTRRISPYPPGWALKEADEQARDYRNALKDWSRNAREQIRRAAEKEEVLSRWHTPEATITCPRGREFPRSGEYLVSDPAMPTPPPQKNISKKRSAFGPKLENYNVQALGSGKALMKARRFQSFRKNHRRIGLGAKTDTIPEGEKTICRKMRWPLPGMGFFKKM